MNIFGSYYYIYVVLLDIRTLVYSLHSHPIKIHQILLLDIEDDDQAA
jgi:hypothetical protein